MKKNTDYNQYYSSNQRNQEYSTHNQPQQNNTSWGKSLPSQGSSGWGQNVYSNQASNFGDSLKYPPQMPYRESDKAYMYNQDPDTRSAVKNFQETQWGNNNIQQGIQQNLKSQGGNFGTDSVFNDSNRAGKRIPNIGFTNSQNNTQHTNKIGQGMSVGIFGNLLSTLFPNPSCGDTSKSLDVTSISDEKKKLRKGTMIIWQYHGGPNQQFYILPFANKKIRIINAASGYSIQVPNNSAQDGAHLLVNPNNNTQNEQFELIEYTRDKNKKDIYQIKTFCGKVLDCEHQSQSNGTRVIQWTANNGKNQLWKITPA